MAGSELANCNSYVCAYCCSCSVNTQQVRYDVHNPKNGLRVFQERVVTYHFILGVTQFTLPRAPQSLRLALLSYYSIGLKLT